MRRPTACPRRSARSEARPDQVAVRVCAASRRAANFQRQSGFFNREVLYGDYPFRNAATLTAAGNIGKPATRLRQTITRQLLWTVAPHLGIASCMLPMARQSAHVRGLAGVLLLLGVGLCGLARMGRRAGAYRRPSLRR